ncbi:MAG: heparan-alpha-glucosaminide N-acetyltransferase [Collinsella sp.]
MQKRITIFDTVRGFTMISMAGFHACYDLAYLYGWDMPWFTQTVFQDIWRASISWVFLFIAGWMCTLSRNNAKRAAKYAAAALVVWIATTLVSVDDSVNFGIIFCMAACTAIIAFARPASSIGCRRWHRIYSDLPDTLFACTWSIPGTSTYPIPYLAWLGFPGPDFVSGDYYPLIPFFFMYLTGFFAAHAARKSSREAPAWAYENPIPALASLGRHALPFYLLHQPIILGILELVYSVR